MGPRFARTSKTQAEAAPEQIIAFLLLERNRWWKSIVHLAVIQGKEGSYRLYIYICEVVVIGHLALIQGKKGSYKLSVCRPVYHLCVYLCVYLPLRTLSRSLHWELLQESHLQAVGRLANDNGLKPGNDKINQQQKRHRPRYLRY
jgi:hypothetical protein